MPSFFITNLFQEENRFLYLSWIVTVTISIVLHELAHGWAAIRHGDRTPIQMGRMTGNPLVHMGPFSLIVLLLFGIAWGQMPVDPTRLRGKYAEAKVAAAGPAMNLTLAFVCAIALGLLFRFGPNSDVYWLKNLQKMLFVAASANFLLCAFNLMPVPPLDGSHILANLSRPYARFISDPSKQGLFIFAFIFAFTLAGHFWTYAYDLTESLVRFVQTVGT